MFAELELLFHLIRSRADQLNALAADAGDPAPLTGADEHVLASALQKSIRRGDLAIARRAGHQLITLNAQRCWRRIMVVALEDIGVGDVDAAVELIAIATSRECRRLIGGDKRSLDIAIVRGCSAVKDRTGDHVLSVLAREVVPACESDLLARASHAELLQLIRTSSVPLIRRIRAAMMIGGRYGGASGVRITGPIAELLDLFRKLEIPQELVAACAIYASKADDALPVIIPLAWSVRRLSGREGGVAIHRVPKGEFVGELPAYSFDPLHTRAGRTALSLWLRSYSAKLPWSTRMVGLCLWNSEAALCDRTACWPRAAEIRERALRADLVSCGLPEIHHGELCAWIAHEMPRLNRMREYVWNSPQPELRKPKLSQPVLPLPLVDVPRSRDR